MTKQILALALLLAAGQSTPVKATIYAYNCGDCCGVRRDCCPSYCTGCSSCWSSECCKRGYGNVLCGCCC